MYQYLQQLMLGVASLYRDWMQGFVIDERDAALVPEIEALGLRVEATETIMRSPEIAASLAERVLALADRCRAAHRSG